MFWLIRRLLDDLTLCYCYAARFCAALSWLSNFSPTLTTPTLVRIFSKCVSKVCALINTDNSNAIYAPNKSIYEITCCMWEINCLVINCTFPLRLSGVICYSFPYQSHHMEACSLKAFHGPSTICFHHLDLDCKRLIMNKNNIFRRLQGMNLVDQFYKLNNVTKWNLRALGLKWTGMKRRDQTENNRCFFIGSLNEFISK